MEKAPEEFRRAIYEHYPPTRLFAVVSWGCAATDWLAYSLNECPGIFCLHGANFLWNKFAGAQWLSGLEYLEVIGMQGHAALVAGDVHGVSRTDIPEIEKKYRDRFRAAVVVRDPLPRLRSQLALFGRYAQFELWGDLRYLQGMFPEIVNSLPKGSYEELLFLHGVNMLNAIVEEVAVGPVFRMEDITTNPQKLAAMVEHLTAGIVVAPECWLNSAVSSGGTNRHAKGALAFSDWQVDVIRGAVRSDAIELYGRLGYDVSDPII
jgi:hypothetical protein